MMKTFLPPLVFGLAILACVRAVLMSYLAVFPLADATAYLAAARTLARHGDIYAPRAAIIPPPYLYTPLLAWLLQPTALLSPLLAAYVWIAMLGISACLLIAVLTRIVPLPVAAVAVLAFVPTYDALWLGQVDLFVAAGVALALTSRPTRAGVALGLVALLKTTPAVILVYLLARRQWRVIGAALACAVVALFLIPDPLLWVRGVFSASQAGGSPYIVSLPFVLGRELGWAGTVLAYAIIAVLAFLLLLHPISAPWTIAIAMLLPIIGAPIVWVHHAAMALPALALLWRERPRTAMLLWLALSILAPSYQPLTLVALTLLCLVQSHPWPVWWNRYSTAEAQSP